MPNKVVEASRPRGRVQQGAKGPYVQMYNPKPMMDYEDYVARFARTQFEQLRAPGDFVLPLTGYRVLMHLRVNKVKPVSYPARVVDWTQAPDADNLEKTVLDGLVKAGILRDDSMITDLSIAKRFVAPGHPEGVEIDLTAIPTEVP